jgi:hypothetical protein
MTRRLTTALAAVLIITLLLAGCGGDGASTAPLAMAPVSQLPAELRSAPASVQEAYRFAIANQELLSQIPCFCGCVASGHTSNLSCYLVESDEPGAILQFDNHALG